MCKLRNCCAYTDTDVHTAAAAAATTTAVCNTTRFNVHDPTSKRRFAVKAQSDERHTVAALRIIPQDWDVRGRMSVTQVRNCHT
jgi:hypothetical protein